MINHGNRTPAACSWRIGYLEWLSLTRPFIWPFSHTCWWATSSRGSRYGLRVVRNLRWLDENCPTTVSTNSCEHTSPPITIVCLLLFYLLATSNIISGQGLTCGSVPTWWRFSTVPLENQAASTMTWFSPIQSHYPDTKPTSPCPIQAPG